MDFLTVIPGHVLATECLRQKVAGELAKMETEARANLDRLLDLRHRVKALNSPTRLRQLDRLLAGQALRLTEVRRLLQEV